MQTVPKALDLSGKRVRITGAAGGIGAAVARLAGGLGAELVLTDLGKLDRLAGELRDAGVTVTAQPCDIDDRAAVEALVHRAGPLDGVVALAAFCPSDDWNEPGWDEMSDRVMRTNVLGVIHCARAAVPGMTERRSGRMVIVSSVAGRMGGLRASPHYVASKGGVTSLVKWLARRGAPQNVLVNGVAPGATASPMTSGQSFDLAGIPLGRLAEPDEIAWPIVFLLTGAASHQCGTVVDVNGGVYMH